MTDFPSNSQRPRKALHPEPPAEAAEKGKVDKVVEGEVVVRKKSMAKRFRETFIAEDGMTIREYVIQDIFIPAFRDLIYDVTIGSVERALFRDGRPGNRAFRASGRGGFPGGGGGFRYDLAARNSALNRMDDPRPSMSRRARAAHDFEEIIFPTRSDAEAVLTRLFDSLDQYNEVKLSEFYELAGISGNFTDERYGWTDLRGSRPVRTRNGWLLDLPRTEQLER
jgi:hypothetical protein